MIRLRDAELSEAETLTALCLRSKAHWGYDETFMATCRAELTIGCADFAMPMQAVREGEVVGLAQLGTGGADAILHKLFIAPETIGEGVGRMLFRWAEAIARQRGAARIWIDADPQAAGFYRRMGAVDDGTIASGSIPGRMLPRLRFDLAKN